MLLVVLSIATAGAVAETIRIPIGAQGSAATAAGLPERGTTEARVLEHYGEPVERHPAVGQPPIERWDYADFSVYFETGHVIHSVLRHRPVAPGN
jgi:hypothetical protein